jgi:hypothetical protein
MKKLVYFLGVVMLMMMVVSVIAVGYPTAPEGMFAYDLGYDAGMGESMILMWNDSTTNQSTLTYDCRIDSEWGFTCDYFEPPANITYELQFTNDTGSTWYHMPPDNYSGCDPCSEASGGNWLHGTTFLDSLNFSEGNLTFRVRAFDGIDYSGWTESNEITNCKAVWNCTQQNTSSCEDDGKYTCLNAIDISGCEYGNLPAEFMPPEDMVYWQSIITNRDSCGCQPNYICVDHSYCHRNYDLNKVNTIQVCTKVRDTNGCNFPTNLIIKRKLDVKNSNDTDQMFIIKKKYMDWWDDVDTITCLEESSKVKIELKGFATNLSSPDGKLKVSYETNSILPPGDIFDWLQISATSIVLNSEEAPEFDKPAKIEMTKLKMSVQPVIYIDRGYLGWVVCGSPYCTNIHWSFDKNKGEGNLDFKVTGFSGYYIGCEGEGCYVPDYTTEDIAPITGDFIATVGVKAKSVLPLFILGLVIVGIGGVALTIKKSFK